MGRRKRRGKFYLKLKNIIQAKKLNKSVVYKKK